METIHNTIYYFTSKFIRGFTLTVFISFILLSGCISTSNQNTITISAASSMEDALSHAIELYNKEYPGTTIHVNYASSGTLANQIINGAPVDIFISASEEKMNLVMNEKRIIDDSLNVLTSNTLVLIKNKNSDTITIESLENLDSKLHFAIGSPESVPAGMYGKESLQTLGLFKPLESNFVFAKNVREVLTWVETGNAEYGICYFSDACKNDYVEILDIFPTASHTPITYPMAIINDTKNLSLTESFTDFLLSETVNQLFADYGFNSYDAYARNEVNR